MYELETFYIELNFHALQVVWASPHPCFHQIVFFIIWEFRTLNAVYQASLHIILSISIQLEWQGYCYVTHIPLTLGLKERHYYNETTHPTIEYVLK